MLIPIGYPPVEISFFQMGINTSSEIITVEARITERHQVMLDKNGSCSNDYNKTFTFVVCSRNYFTKTLNRNTTCSLPGNTVDGLRFLFKGHFGLDHSMFADLGSHLHLAAQEIVLGQGSLK